MLRFTARVLALVTAAAFALAVLPPAYAQERYPGRPIRMIVPFTAGTGIDILARTIGQKLSERLKVPVVVENRAGASGNIGTEAVAKAPADGYTLLMTASTIVQNAALSRAVPYDPVRGFSPIGLTAIGNLALAVHPSVPAKSVAEFVALVKARPGRLNYASPGSGTPHHLAMELFKLNFGIDILHVPYKGTAGAVTDLLGGQVEAMFLPVHVALPQAQAGKIRLLAAGGSRRSAVTPDLPSLAEEGVRDIDVDIWYALFAPVGLPRDLVILLGAEVAAILAQPEVREGLQKQGLNPVTGTPEELARLVESDLERWTRVVRAARIGAD
ncbi:MAG: tripartite tricarboxylate transporter substrate binding protein [Pseudomonadota bacterium]